MSDIDPRFCWLCKKFNERHPCDEVLGQCREWKKFEAKAKNKQHEEPIVLPQFCEDCLEIDECKYHHDISLCEYAFTEG